MSWNNLIEVEKAVQFLIELYQQEGTLPPGIIETYKQTLNTSDDDLVLRFYDLLLDDYYVPGIIDQLN